MNLPEQLLGAPAVRALQATASAWVLRVGKDHLTRGELAAVGCYNFIAARRLSNVLEQELPPAVKGLRDLYERISPGSLAIPLVGAVSLAVLGAAFEAKGIGTLVDWAQKHTQDKLRTFETLKRRERALQAAAKRR